MGEPGIDLIALARGMAQASAGRLRVVRNEADADGSHVPDAATFLKLDGARLGRDLELYRFMSVIQGWPATLADLAAEVVLPLRSPAPEAYRHAVDALLDAGPRLLPPHLVDDWENIFSEGHGAPAP